MTRGSDIKPLRRLLASRYGDEYVIELLASVIIIRPKGSRRGGPAEVAFMPGAIYTRALLDRAPRRRRRRAR